MAELPAIKSGIAPEQFFGELRRIVWTGLTDGDTGEHCLMSEFADRSVQVIGNLGRCSDFRQSRRIFRACRQVPCWHGNGFTSHQFHLAADLRLGVRNVASSGKGRRCYNAACFRQGKILAVHDAPPSPLMVRCWRG